MEEAFKLLSKRPVSFMAVSKTNPTATHGDVAKYFRQHNLNLTRTNLHQGYDYDKPTGIWYCQVPMEKALPIHNQINKNPSFIGLGPRVFATMVSADFYQKSKSLYGRDVTELTGRAIIVRNLPLDCTKDDIRRFFWSQRLVEGSKGIYKVTGRKSNEFLGVAVVSFISDEDAHRAFMERNGDYFDNQQVSISIVA